MENVSLTQTNIGHVHDFPTTLAAYMHLESGGAPPACYVGLQERLNLRSGRMSLVPMQKCDIEIAFVPVRDSGCRSQTSTGFLLDSVEIAKSHLTCRILPHTISRSAQYMTYRGLKSEDRSPPSLETFII